MDALCGFLEAGKTTLIRTMLSDSGLRDACVLVLQCEQGEIEILPSDYPDRRVIVLAVEQPQALTCALIEGAVKQHQPDHILIEYNGTWPIQPLMDVAAARGVVMERVVGIAEAQTLQPLLAGTGSLLLEQFSQCDAMLLRADALPDKAKRASLRAAIKALQPRARVRFYTPQDQDETLHEVFSRGQMKPFDKLMLVLMMLVPLYLLLSILYLPMFESTMGTIQSINTVFLGILLQALPFVLIGVVVSSVLQVMVPDAVLASVFTRYPAMGYPLALVLGALFPVCDCAMIPIGARLMRKGVPQGVAVAFMLAAPVVNPVVIASTLYAFPGQPMVAVARVGLGVLVALLVGRVMELLPKGKQAFATADLPNGALCASGYMGTMVLSGRLGKAEAVLRHATQELLDMGRYVVLGSLLSAVIQVLLPATWLGSLGGGTAGAILVMMAAAFLMSVCATSEAFIARSFASAFAPGPLMAFMVLGPMLDLKNILMLSGSFHRRFVVRLVAVLLPIAFVLLLGYALLIG